MNKILFLAVLFSPAFAGADSVFVEGDFKYSNCVYLKYSPTRSDLAQSCGGSDKAAKQGLCVGTFQCDYVNSRSGETGKNYRTAACEGNANGSCPPPVECYKAVDDFLVHFEDKPKIQSKAEAEAALAEQRARQYGNRSGVGQTTHTSGGR